jgi:hypothetical protein
MNKKRIEGVPLRTRDAERGYEQTHEGIARRYGGTVSIRIFWSLQT